MCAGSCGVLSRARGCGYTSGRGRTTTSRSASRSTSRSAAGGSPLPRLTSYASAILTSAFARQGRPLRPVPRRLVVRRLFRAVSDVRKRAAVLGRAEAGRERPLRVCRARGVGRWLRAGITLAFYLKSFAALGYGLSTRREAFALQLISRYVHCTAPRMYCIPLMDCIYRHFYPRRAFSRYSVAKL